MSGKRRYLFQRPNSRNWYLRLQYTGALSTKFKSRSVSLGTSDLKEAEIKALPLIAEHKALLLLHAQTKEPFRVWMINVSTKFAPNEVHEMEDGRKVFATADHLYPLENNGDMKERLSNIHADPPELISSVKHRYLRDVKQDNLAKRKAVRRNDDDSIIEIWIKHKNVSLHIQAEATQTWNAFRDLTNSKPLKKCTRDDARLLVDYLKSKNNGPSTIQKKIGHLRSAVNIAIDDGKLVSNPFRKVVPKVRLEKIRLGLSDDDMLKVKAKLHLLSEEDRLLWKILASTGMRRGEAFQIIEEFEENGTRYVKIGTKTKASRRKVPLPSCIEACVPVMINGPLLKGSADAAGKRLTRFLQRLGIAYDPVTGAGDKRKVLHSLRHRAAGKLDASGCDNKIKKVLMGHSNHEVSDIYGPGFPADLLKKHIECIGY